MSASKGHVFVSHSSDNRELASELAEFLETRGVRAWIAPRDVRPGMDYSEQLQLAIEEAVAFVVLVTDNANQSPYVRAETEMAFSTRKPIFPIRISDIQPAAGLALFLKIRHWTDAYGPTKRNNLDRLARELQALTGAETTEPPPPAPAAPAPPPPPPMAVPPASPALAAAAALPGSAPVVVAALPLLPANAQEEERWRAAVGPKADWYLERWRQMAEKKSAISWNWPACLANLYWFAYRRMWLGVGLVGALYLINFMLITNPQAGRLMTFVVIGITFVTGTFGNHWYRQQTARLVAQTASMDQTTALDTLRRRGGTSTPAVWVAIAVMFVVGLIAGVAMVRQVQSQLNGFAPTDTFNTVSPDNQDNGMVGDKPPPTPDDQMPAEEPPPEEPPPSQY